MATQPTREEVETQRERLGTYRRTLENCLQRQALLGDAHAPSYLSHEIREARENIRRVKVILRNWSIVVEDHPDDEGATPYTNINNNPLINIVRLRTLSFVVPVIIALIGLVGIIVTTRVVNNDAEVRGRQAASAMIQPTISALQTALSIAQDGLSSTQLVTITQVATPTPNPNDNKILPLSSIAFDSYTLVFTDTSKESTPLIISTNLSVLNNMGSQSYTIDFLHSKKDLSHYGRLVFFFKETQDLSRFDFLEIVLTFENENTRTGFYIQDIAGKLSGISVGGGLPLPDGVEDKISGKQHKITIPWSYFSVANKKALNALFFDIDNTAASGSYGITVDSIKFISD
jgi:hypothetical protein